MVDDPHGIPHQVETAGAEEILLPRLLHDFVGAEIASQEICTPDRTMFISELSEEISGKGMTLLLRRKIVRLNPSMLHPDNHEPARYDAAQLVVVPHPAPEGRGYSKGLLPFESKLFAEGCTHCLGAAEPLRKECRCTVLMFHVKLLVVAEATPAVGGVPALISNTFYP
jgi:hypothetical protein